MPSLPAMPALPLPQGPIAEASILAHAAPLLAQLMLRRDALTAGIDPMALRSMGLSPTVRTEGVDKLELNDGSNPTPGGASIADGFTQAIEHVMNWAIDGLWTARALEAERARNLLEAHATFHIMASMTPDEIREVNDSDGDTQPGAND